MNKGKLQLCCIVVVAFVSLSVTTAFGQPKRSPINFRDEDLTLDNNLAVPEFTYPAVAAKVRDRGGHHTGADVLPPLWEPPPPNTLDASFADTKMRFIGNDWTLHGFHFHLASEHRRFGSRFDMEVHLVHKRRVDPNRIDIMVVGRWITMGGDLHPELNKVFNPLPGPAVGDPFAEFNINFDLATLLPPEDKRQSYRYTGSLTAEGDEAIAADWIFFDNPLKISDGQYNKFKNYLLRRGLNGNANLHDIPLGGRVILSDVPEPSAMLVSAVIVGLATLRRQRRGA